MWASRRKTEEVRSQIRERWRGLRESLKKRHVCDRPSRPDRRDLSLPRQGLTPEQLSRAELKPGQTLLADRRYAIEDGPSGFDPAEPKWLPKPHFLMLMRDEWRGRPAQPIRRCEQRPLD